MKFHVNQVGYLPDSVKIAIADKMSDFSVINAADNSVALEGVTTHSSSEVDPASGEIVYHADFSRLKTPGNYFIKGEDGSISPTFSIGADVYEDLKRALIKALYFQRCGCALEEKYAGEYKHGCCHTKKAKLYEDQTKEFDMQGGWHDAGDYGRYTTAASVALGHLLYGYEFIPTALSDNLNIPESDNDIPDLLNECLYELKWMLKMQREDGAVYHKLTSFNHVDFMMPEEDDAQFYIFPISTMATADFCAIMYCASRVYALFDADFSAQAYKQARLAEEYLRNNPEYVGFHNPEGSNTGEYDDDCDIDERIWAAVESLRMNQDLTDAQRQEYVDFITQSYNKLDDKTDMGWTNVAGIAGIAILSAHGFISKDLYQMVSNLFIEEGNHLLALLGQSGYRIAMGKDDFIWGSNMVVLNRGMILCMAHMLTGNHAYLDIAAEQLHYLLGKNALSISYVTRFGEHAFKNPHNRTSACDGVELPMPGWVSGGPNEHPVDPKEKSLIPEGTPPMKCYADIVEGYSVNEITIYWNSPAVFLTAYLCYSK